ncbi:MAG TPA: lipopolysaccharide biosynthesis protein, partial [Gemmataceae bacterium]|nr:lipopolysaccharide biosynthesis protein [Gemmataceae bacterium]
MQALKTRNSQDSFGVSASLRPLQSFVERLLAGKNASPPENELKTKLVGDTFNYFLSKVVPGLMGLLSVATFVRMVGYEQYGRYAVAFATVTAFSAGVAGWLSQSILRFHSRHHGTAEAESFNRAADAGLLVSAVLGGIALGLALWLSRTHSAAMVAVSVGLYAAMLVYTFEMTRLQAVLDSRGVVRMETTRAIGAFVIPLVLILAISQRHYTFLLLGILGGYLIPLVARAFDGSGRRAIMIFHRPLLDEQERGYLRSLWSYGWPVALWLFSQQSLVVSDRYFIQRFWGYSAAGVYASMYDVVVRSFSLLFVPITLAVHTALMHNWNTGSRHLTRRIISQAIKFESLLFLPVAAVLFLGAGWASRLVLGHGNPEAASIVLPLAIGGFLWQLALLAHKPLEILCQTKRMLAGGLVALAVNVVGNYFLVPRFGYR